MLKQDLTLQIMKQMDRYEIEKNNRVVGLLKFNENLLG